MSRMRVVMFMMSFAAASGRHDIAEAYTPELLRLFRDGYCITCST